MAQGPRAGLSVLDGLEERLGDHHRLHAVRAHLLELAGDAEAAIVEFRSAASGTGNLREQRYLSTKAARLATELTGRAPADTAQPLRTYGVAATSAQSVSTTGPPTDPGEQTESGLGECLPMDDQSVLHAGEGCP